MLECTEGYNVGFRTSFRSSDSKTAPRSWTQAPRSDLPTRVVAKRTNSVRHPLPRPAQNRCVFWVQAVAPFRLDFTVWALRRRPSNLIDRWDGHTYRRVLVIGQKPIEVAVTQTGSPETPRLQVSLTGNKILVATRAAVREALERLLGLRVELGAFYRLAARDSKLAPLVERFRGVKPPRFPRLFEALANAVACQQMSLSLGMLLLSRLTQTFGLAARKTADSPHGFPRPAELAGLKPGHFRKLGFSRQKGRALIALAQTFCEGPQQWDALETLDNRAAVERLLGLRGIGRWSAEYVLLRGLGRLDVYPGDDVGARNNLRRWLGLRRTLDYEGVRRITARWQPYAGLVYFHMLLDRLAEAGYLNSGDGERQPGGGA